ncbi:MAG: D-alanyl-D-alanine carboxypeptidase family protein [Pseudomonadota bacterium]
MAQVIGSIVRVAACVALFLGAQAWPGTAMARTNDGPAVPPESDVPIALLVDISSGQVLHARNADRRFVPASITKVMTTFLAFELIEDGALDTAQVITVSEETAREWSGKGSSMWVDPGDRILVADLLTGIANVSANDGAIVLAEGHAGSVEGWTAMMTAKAREIGMLASHFGTPNGWPDNGYTFTTANDLVTLARTMITRHPLKFANFVGRPGFSYNGRTQRNRDPITGQVDGADGIKTGYTNESGFGFLGTASRRGQRLVMVLGGAYSSSVRDRYARSYIEWGFSAFDRQRLFESEQVVGIARIQNGDRRELQLVTDRTVFVNVPEKATEALSARIFYDGPLRAPIAAGERVATLEITVPGMEPARLPLLAGTEVRKAGFFARITNAIARWLA